MTDSYLSPSITNEGINLLIKALNGENIAFTKIVLGDGVPSDKNEISDIANKRLEIGISEMETHEGYIILTGYCNSSKLEESFYGKELGVYAKGKDENEVLYAYRYSEAEVDFFPSKDSGRTLEVVLSVVVQIGKAENVTAILIESDAYASKTDFKNHCDERNPHKTTADDVGAAPKAHGHNAKDITGILPVTKGGTGVASYEQMAQKINEKLNVKAPQLGIYTGNGAQGRVIDLGFKPSAVILCDNYGNMHDDINGYVGGVAIGKYGCCSQRGSVQSAESWSSGYTTLMIVDNGFRVNYYPENKVYSNANGRTYRYIAFR